MVDIGSVQDIYTVCTRYCEGTKVGGANSTVGGGVSSQGSLLGGGDA